MEERKSQKKIIAYSRDYRYLKRPKWNNLFFLMLCVVPVVLCFVLFYDPITLALANWSAKIVASITQMSVSIVSDPYFPGLGDVHYIDMAGTNPSFTYSLISVILSLLFVLIASQANRNSRPLMIYLSMGGYIHLISSLFFLLAPESFPYTLTEYSELYMKQQISIWIMIVVIAGVATFLIATAGISQYVAFLVTALYSFLYGCLRYVVFLVFLYYATSIFMATLFFTFGVLFDFLQLVAVYSIFIRHVSTRMERSRGKKVWQW